MMGDDMARPNIVIAGAWRSGTTLLYLYFPFAFADVVISGRETPALATDLPASFSWRVSKSPNDIHRAREIQAAFDPWIIYMLRDPRDCIVSWKMAKNDYHLAFNEWLRNLLFARGYKSDKLIWLHFERLISEPETMQEQLAQTIGLQSRIPFAECHKYIPRDGPIHHQLAHGIQGTIGPAIRPLDLSVIGSWQHDKARIQQQLEQFPEMQAVLEWMEYEDDDAWQHNLM